MHFKEYWMHKLRAEVELNQFFLQQTAYSLLNNPTCRKRNECHGLNSPQLSVTQYYITLFFFEGESNKPSVQVSMYTS